MLLTGCDSISDVILFPTMKPLDVRKDDKPAVKETLSQAAEVIAAQLQGMPANEAPIDFSKVEIEPLLRTSWTLRPSADPTSAPSR